MIPFGIVRKTASKEIASLLHKRKQTKAFCFFLFVKMVLAFPVIGEGLYAAGGEGPDSPYQISEPVLGPTQSLFSWLHVLLAALQGPIARGTGAICMIGVLFGMMMKAQRGENVNSLLTIGLCLIFLMGLRDLMSLIGQDVASTMM